MKILVAGDYCPRDRVSKLIEQGRGSQIFDTSLLQLLSKSDYNIVNFECAVERAGARPIPKCGPNLQCSAKAVSVLKETGFNCVTLANNHFRDYGNEGVEETILTLDAEGIGHVGGGKDLEEAELILYKKIGDETLAIINVCENEFSIASNRRAGSAPLDTIDVVHRISEARGKSNYVMLIIHGGHEHWQYPSPRMVKLYRFFIESGADAVVNHHQHCYSGFEEYLGKPIFYGLGNFCFDHPKKRGGIWNEGYMVTLEFADEKVNYDVVPYTQCDKHPAVEMMVGAKLQVFEQKLHAINTIIANDRMLEEKWCEFLKRKGDNEITPFTPYNNEYLRAMAGRRWLPYLISQKKMAKMLNFIMCEAHRDILINAMQNKIERE